MTRLTRKEKSLTMAMILLIIVLIAIALSSCRSANGLLRHAERDIQKAIAKGATVTHDTTWQAFHFKSPEINFSTTLKPTWQNLSLSKDTLRSKDEKTGSKTKVKISLAKTCPDSCIREVYIDTEVPPQNVKENIPVATNTTIKAGHGFWYDVRISLIAAVVGFVIGAMFWASLRAWIRSLI